jgi:hypothetical protein
MTTITNTPIFAVALSKAQTRALAHCEGMHKAGLLTVAAVSANKAVAAMAAPVARRLEVQKAIQAGFASQPRNLSNVARILSMEAREPKLECVKGAKGLTVSVLDHAQLCADWIKAGATDATRERRAAHVGNNLAWIHTMVLDANTIEASEPTPALT